MEPLLSLHSDGMTSPQEAALITRHLADCPDCRRALEWMQATRRVIAERPPVLPPFDMRARIAQAIADSERPIAPVRVAPRTWSLRPVYAAAATITAHGVIGLMAEYPLSVAKVVSSPAVAPSPATSGMREATNPKFVPAPLRNEPGRNIAKSTPSNIKSVLTASTRQQFARRPVTKTDQLRPVFQMPASNQVAELPTQHTSSVVLAHTPSAVVVHVRRQMTSVPLLATLPAAPRTGSFPRQTSHPRPPQMVATRLPADSGKDAHNDVLVPTTPAMVTTPAPIQVAHVDVPDGLRPQHEAVHVDLLNSVRMRLASINKEDVTHKIYAAYGAAEQSSSLIRQVPFVQGAIAYTPTALPSTNPDQVH